jgi:threonine aldolase
LLSVDRVVAAGSAQGINLETIDLRSDLLAHATPAMRAAANAAENSRHFGLREDPNQIALEQRLAQILGHDDALVFPTCTMANTTAIMLLAPRGSRVVTHGDAHVITSEAGAASALAGVALMSLPGDPALPEALSWQQAADSSHDPQRPPTALFVLENTHNRAGGIPLPVAYVREVLAIARSRGVRAHLDGSRIFNAATALDVPVNELCRGFDTVAVSLNKGYGAPIGAVLAGSKPLIDEALVVRQRLGGGMRPTGPAAAATLAALDDAAPFANAHALAARLAHALASLDGLRVDPAKSKTNIVVAGITRKGLTAGELRDRLAAHGLLVLPFDQTRLRFITYRGISESDIEKTVSIVRAVMVRADSSSKS